MNMSAAALMIVTSLTPGLPTEPCDPAGPQAQDAVVADAVRPLLNGKLRGHMTAYQISCGRTVVQAVRDYGLNQKAAAIAVATIIVESEMRNVGGGHATSVGLYQQQDFWGSYEQRMSPQWATYTFLEVMERFYPNQKWETAPIGDVAADVQRPHSELRRLYEQNAEDAVTIVKALTAG